MTHVSKNFFSLLLYNNAKNNMAVDEDFWFFFESSFAINNSFLCRALLENIIITGLVLVMTLQISFSFYPEKRIYFSQLPSVKYIKEKFILSTIGKSAKAYFSILAFRYKLRTKNILISDFDYFFIINDLIETNSMVFQMNETDDHLRDNWKIFLKRSMKFINYNVNNFPFSNKTFLNNKEVQFLKDLGLKETLKFLGINKKLLNRFQLDLNHLVDSICLLYLDSGYESDINYLIFEEPKKIISKLEREVFGKRILRQRRSMKNKVSFI